MGGGQSTGTGAAGATAPTTPPRAEGEASPATNATYIPPHQVLPTNPPDIDEFLREITPEISPKAIRTYGGWNEEETMPKASEMIWEDTFEDMWESKRALWEYPPEMYAWEVASSEWEEEEEENLAKIAEPSSPPSQGAIVPNLAERLTQRKPQHRWRGVLVENAFCKSCEKNGYMSFRPLQGVGTNPNEIYKSQCEQCCDRREVNRWGVEPKTKDVQCQASEEDFKNLKYLTRTVRNSANMEW